MVKIKVRMKIDAPRERVWETISDSDNDKFFWRGITSIRNLSRNENTLIRQIVLGNGLPCLQMVTTWPMEKIRTEWVDGVIDGTREIVLVSMGKTTLLEIQMNYEFPGVGASDSKSLAKLFQNEAGLAVDLIKRKSEEFYSDSDFAKIQWVN
ncbi:MAG TPA: SRPBCC family protein [Candidatus Nitrosotalea sp.]|nr:SRPBCC family protein [Candidatus Nitrosotalea sp.]